MFNPAIDEVFHILFTGFMLIETSDFIGKENKYVIFDSCRGTE